MIFHRFFLTFHDFLIEDISLFPTLHRNDYILQKRTCVIQIDDDKLSDINSDSVPTVARITYCQDVTDSFYYYY